ncbi:MAG TPA: CHAD domain-containing protein [Steroidobacteraceae bacterium]|nr:CHAD domain-containing protein [Steroidobacteraceae bacterium]
MSSNARPTNTDPGHKDGREVEWQLASTDLGAVHRWLSEHATIDGLVLEPRTTLKILDTYLDTDDWRIHRAGFALRIRSESGKSEATLKALRSASAAVADRRELSETLHNEASESIRQSTGPVGTRVQAVSGARALVPLFEVRTSRRRFAIRQENEGRQLGEIALDGTVISRPDGEPRTSMQRVEVEALTETHEPLLSLVKSLRNNCALEAASESKYSQGLKSVGLAPAPAPVFAPTTVDRSMTLAEVALANLRRYLSDWNLHEPGARLGDDPEELHDLRVAGRRLEAVLRQFRSSLPDAFLRIRPTLKAVLRALGEVRDLDVALGELESFCRELPRSERESAGPLKQHLLRERSRARAHMISVLDSVWVQKSLLEWTALLAEPSEALKQASPERAISVVPEMIRRRYRKVRKGADLLRSDSPAEAYHQVRSQVKKLRYALEAISTIYGKPADDMLRALRRWQERLGVQQDAAMAGRRLRTLAGAPAPDMPPETLFLMGRLAEHHAGASERACRLQSKSYRKVRDRYRRMRPKLKDAAAHDPPSPARSGP